MMLIDRAEARSLGLKRYFTGDPCKNGHLEERNVSSGACLGCMREYHKDRYHNDPADREYHKAEARAWFREVRSDPEKLAGVYARNALLRRERRAAGKT